MLSDKALTIIFFFIRGPLENSSGENSNSPGPLATLLKPVSLVSFHDIFRYEDRMTITLEIMRHMPEHPNVVTLKETYEDEHAMHLVMELCEGVELFDRIVARGHYTERAAAVVTKTIMAVVQLANGLQRKHSILSVMSGMSGTSAASASRMSWVALFLINADLQALRWKGVPTWEDFPLLQQASPLSGFQIFILSRRW
ncbi:hypothetical protein F2Q70_00027360 [Brassica cretica]|uniref:Protein kinase domain-containing protein n=1 Tax=Brassica cretica TaxID=69181 RepID=A0A8S9L8S4_BRACR|nr:hypothetical protein F2Q70_00027360 [Brassica cretica]